MERASDDPLLVSTVPPFSAQLRSLVRENPAMLPQVLQGLASQSPVSKPSFCDCMFVFIAVFSFLFWGIPVSSLNCVRPTDA